MRTGFLLVSDIIMQKNDPSIVHTYIYLYQVSENLFGTVQYSTVQYSTAKYHGTLIVEIYKNRFLSGR